MTSTERRHDLLGRVAIPMAGVMATALLALLSRLRPAWYLAVMRPMIEWPQDDPAFADWAVTPGALGCWARGVVVYLPNRCTPTFNYSPVFLLFPAPPGGPFWNAVFGFGIALVFFASLALLAPPRSRFEFAVRLLATLSPGIALGVERGNLDLPLFVLLLVGSLAIARWGWANAAGYLVFIVAALLKFYPVAALFLAVRERPLRLFAVGLAAVLAGAWLFVTFREPLGIILANLPPSTEWTLEFNGLTLPGGLAAGAPAVAAGLRALFLTLMAGAAVLAWRAGTARGVALPARPSVLLPMVMGAIVLLFCFIRGQNYLYRGVYLLPVLPGLFATARTAPPAAGRAIAGACLLMAAGLWMPVVRWAAIQTGLWNHEAVQGALWLGYQLGWWCIAAVLCTVALAFLLGSRTGRAALRLLPVSMPSRRASS